MRFQLGKYGGQLKRAHLANDVGGMDSLGKEGRKGGRKIYIGAGSGGGGGLAALLLLCFCRLSKSDNGACFAVGGGFGGQTARPAGSPFACRPRRPIGPAALTQPTARVVTVVVHSSCAQRLNALCAVSSSSSSYLKVRLERIVSPIFSIQQQQLFLSATLFSEKQGVSGSILKFERLAGWR